MDWQLLKETIELVTRLGSRITLASQWHPEWDRIQKRDRLLGVSMTGVMDAFDLLNWNYEQQEYFFKWCKEIAISAANSYHDYLGINRSARVCLMKPEGTLSQLPTVSSGIHRAYAPYYLRRVRFSKSDPLAQVLLNLGLKPVPENGQGLDKYNSICQDISDLEEIKVIFSLKLKTVLKYRIIRYLFKFLPKANEMLMKLESSLKTLINNRNKADVNYPNSFLNWEYCNSWVFTFPIRTDAKTRAIDEPAISQLERYKLAQKNYADRGHNTSVTVTLAPDEYEITANWVNDNWEDIIGIAFLPRFDPVEGGKASYPLMPYEPCDQETYERLKSQLPDLSQSEIIEALIKIEKSFEEQELEKGCSTGACPVR